MVTAQSGFPSAASAISGLATDSDNSYGPNLIKQLRNASIITDAVFSFYLSKSGSSSYLDVGYVDPDAMLDSSNLIMIDILENNYWWAQKVTAIRFGNDE